MYSSTTCTHSPAPCSSTGIYQRTPELAPGSLHIWEQVLTEYVTEVKDFGDAVNVILPVTVNDMFDGGSVMVWGCISLECRAEPSVMIHRILTALRYWDHQIIMTWVSLGCRRLSSSFMNCRNGEKKSNELKPNYTQRKHAVLISHSVGLLMVLLTFDPCTSSSRRDKVWMLTQFFFFYLNTSSFICDNAVM